MSDDFPKTVYCLEVSTNSPAIDDHITTQLDDWSDEDTGTVDVVDSREYIRKDDLRELVDEWRNATRNSKRADRYNVNEVSGLAKAAIEIEDLVDE